MVRVKEEVNTTKAQMNFGSAAHFLLCIASPVTVIAGWLVGANTAVARNVILFLVCCDVSFKSAIMRVRERLRSF